MHADNVPQSSWKLAVVKKVLGGFGVTNRSIKLLYPLEVILVCGIW